MVIGHVHCYQYKRHLGLFKQFVALIYCFYQVGYFTTANEIFYIEYRSLLISV